MFVQNRTQEAIWKTCKTWCIDAKSINMFLKYRLYVVICIRYVKYVVCLMECRPYDCVGEIQSFEMMIYHIYIYILYISTIYIYIYIYLSFVRDNDEYYWRNFSLFTICVEKNNKARIRRIRRDFSCQCRVHISTSIK